MSTCLDTWLPAYDDVSLMPAWLSNDPQRTGARSQFGERSWPLQQRVEHAARRPSRMILSGVENGNEQFKQSPLCIHSAIEADPFR